MTDESTLLINAAVSCAQYRSDHRKADARLWRQRFDELNRLRDAVEKRVLRADRDRLALMAADAARLAANAPGNTERYHMREVVDHISLVSSTSTFNEAGNFLPDDGGDDGR